MGDLNSDEEMRRLAKLAGDGDLEAAERLVAVVRRVARTREDVAPAPAPRDPAAYANLKREEATVWKGSLGPDPDHGVLTLLVHFERPGWRQAFGGFVIGGGETLNAMGADLVDRVCRVLQVADVRDAAGKTTTVLSRGGIIAGIEKDGRILLVDDWVADWKDRPQEEKFLPVRHYTTRG